MLKGFKEPKIDPQRALAVLSEFCLQQQITAPTKNTAKTAARVCTDSRLVKAGDIYLAYKGVHTDGHQFLGAVCQQQPSLLVLEDETLLPEACTINWIKVSSVRQAWAWLCYEAFDCAQTPLIHIGITGTNGKTSTAWLVRELLESCGEPVLLVGTLGVEFSNQVIESPHTTPDPDVFYHYYRQAALAGVRYCVMEVSSHAIQQEKLAPLNFDYAGFTSFSRDHLDLHGSMAAYFDTKQQFVRKQADHGAQVFIHEDVIGNALFQETSDFNFKTYGLDPKSDFRLAATAIRQGLTHLEISHQEQQTSFEVPLSGDFLIDNFGLAFAIVHSIKPQALCQTTVSALRGVPGRLEYIQHQDPTLPHIYVDYAHTPDALEKALATLKKLKPERLWVVFGCGGDRDQGKRPLMAAAAELDADRIVITNDNPRHEEAAKIIEQIQTGFKNTAKVKTLIDRRTAIEYAIQNATKNDIVLIAGKGHENYMEIGDQRLHFDDRETARDILTKKSQT